VDNRKLRINRVVEEFGEYADIDVIGRVDVPCFVVSLTTTRRWWAPNEVFVRSNKYVQQVTKKFIHDF